MMKTGDAYVDELIGLLLQEEERLAFENKRHTQSAILPSPLPSSVTTSSASTAYSHNSSRNNHLSSHHGNSHGRNNSSQRDDNRSSYAPSGTSRCRTQCQICGKMGHLAIDCFNRNNNNDYPAQQFLSRPSEQSANYASPSAVVDPSWYFDTGTTDHITPDLNKLNISDEYRGDDKLLIGNGNQLFISHYGSTILPSMSNSICLKDILVVPKLTKSLLSVSKLIRNNPTFIEFYPDHCVLKTL
ncbi:Zinc finger CCHC-type protein [Dioscorea alata]|uniref:Zinc finger CCHC-type protein n=1 Tax=Dioscorea alata TaxID=55571 RepID=A0ACB7U634_DIOAL|nr:Zinc finger CCHC-type protein [Dioscorea alata]